jgi:capsid protein
MSYVTLGNDLEAVNYSSAQVGIIAEREHFKRTQTRLRDWLHRRIFAAALPYLAAAGGLALSRVKNGEYLDAATWQPRRWVPIDPLKAANANETNLRLGLTSRRRLIMERGEDPDEIAAEIAAETAIYGALDSSPAQPAAPAEDIEDANARAAIRHLKLAASRGYPDGA